MYFPQTATHPLALVRLRGSQAQMGAQLGEVLGKLGGWQPLVDFYPIMARRVLMMRVPPKIRRLTEPALQRTLALLVGRLERYRRKHFPAYMQRTLAMVDAVRVDKRKTRWLLGMDVMQNVVGAASRTRLGPLFGLSITAIPACSSLAVWGRASSDGTLRHARNFDLPGVSVWDLAPLVTLCEPDEGLRYGFVTTRGADAPGVSAFNEAGLTLSINSRFHRAVAFRGTSAMDMGHEIIRRASTLDEAVSVAREMRSASSWGFLVSSAAEQDAVVLDVNADRIDVVRTEPGSQHLACTNRYLSPELQAGEITTSEAYVVSSDSRFARLDSVARNTRSGLSRSDLEHLLGDLTDIGAHDNSEETVRLAGGCITSPMSVKSIVSEPERRQIRVSVGRAPTGLGPYVTVPWDWAGEVGLVGLYTADDAERTATKANGETLSTEELQALQTYVEAARLQFEGARRREVRHLMDRAVALSPNEPHFRFLTAILALSDRDLKSSTDHLEWALSLEAGPFRRALFLLWMMRVYLAQGRRTEAEVAFDELMNLRHPNIEPFKRAATKEHKRPRSAASLARTIPDMLLIDG